MPEKQRGLVLVTGAAGFTGHHMVMEAVKAGFMVRATDVSSHYYSALFESLGVEFVASDLTKPEGLDQLVEGVEGIFHVAGIHDYSTPDKVIFAINVGGVENLCAAAVRAKVKRFIHWSSVAVYGYDWHDRQPVPEDAPKLTPPLNNYNQSKWEGEKVLQRYMQQEDLPAVILRPAAIYGERCEYGLYYIFKQIYRERRKKKNLMVGQGRGLESFLHVEDMCRAAIHAYDQPDMTGEAYNVADDTRITLEEFFRLTSRYLLGMEKEFTRVPKGLLIPVAVVSQLLARLIGGKSLLEKATLQFLSCDKCWDNRKLKATGFEFKYPLVEEGLKETMDWYKSNGWFKP